MELTRTIQTDAVRQTIMRSIVDVCLTLGIKVIAEGIETVEELQFLRQLGVRMFQGYLFARPGFESLLASTWPELPLDPALAESTLALSRA